jgi:subtilisin family serine protease
LTALLLAVLSGLLVLSGRASAQSDPLLSQQWHLLDPNTEPAGANVLAVWPITKGAGIVIGIVDDGVQSTHPDLSPNINVMLSTGFNLMGQPAGSFNPPQPISCNPALLSNDVLGDGCRGTAVAGIAAARDNTLGGSGVAPRATIAALRLLDPSTGDFFAQPGADLLLAGAIGFNNAAIHIKNFSWGPSDDGATLVSLGPLASTALATAATTGRGGTVRAGGRRRRPVRQLQLRRLRQQPVRHRGRRRRRRRLAGALQRSVLGPVRGGAVERRRAQHHDHRSRR